MVILLALGGCRVSGPEEPVPQTGHACCTSTDATQQHFSGCHVRRTPCRRAEVVEMFGRVTCGPVDEANCEGGRCCTYVSPTPPAETPTAATSPTPPAPPAGGSSGATTGS